MWFKQQLTKSLQNDQPVFQPGLEAKSLYNTIALQKNLSHAWQLNVFNNDEEEKTMKERTEKELK